LPFSDPPVGDGGDRHEGQVHPAQAQEGPQLQADGRRGVRRANDDRLHDDFLLKTLDDFQSARTD